MNLQSTSQSQTCTKKRSWSLFGGLPPIWSTRAFWIPVKSLYLRSMVGKLMRCTENCTARSQHQSTKRAPIFSPAMLTACHKTNASEVERIGLQSFASSAIFTRPLASWQPLLQASQQLFAGKMLPYQQDAENAFQEFIKSGSTNFYTTGINKLISCWQKYVDCNVLFWLIKMCLSLVIMI